MKHILLLLIISTLMLGKDREWVPGTVASIEQIPSRVMHNNASTNYTIRTESATYTLEDGASTYYTAAPKEFLSVGEAVQISLDGSKHAFVKTEKIQKRLRLVGTSRSKE